MSLLGALHFHEGALRASLQAVYGLRLLLDAGGRVEPARGPRELGDLIAHLPPGSALWLAVGGDTALTGTEALLREVVFRIEVADWHAGESKGRRPERLPSPPTAEEKGAQVARASAKATAWETRQARRRAAKGE